MLIRDLAVRILKNTNVLQGFKVFALYGYRRFVVIQPGDILYCYAPTATSPFESVFSCFLYCLLATVNIVGMV